jgi:hypothetical protein
MSNQAPTQEQIKAATEAQNAIQMQKKFAFATHLFACGKTKEQVKAATARYEILDRKRAERIDGFRNAILGTSAA